MRGAYAIARHELARRWTLVLVGLALGLVSFVFARSESPELIRFADMLVTIAVVVCWVISFTTGMSLVGRPLHDGRLSFYFTRPITSSGIAAGKIVGGLVAITCMHVALAVPLAGAFSNLPNLQFEGGRDLAEAATFVGCAFFVVGLVVGILARSRSRWFVVDIAGAAAAAVVAVAMFARLGERKSVIALAEEPEHARALLHRADMFLYALVAAAAIAFLVSVVVGITLGRTDRERVHRAISFTLWPALTAVGLAGIGLTQWGLR